MSLLWKTQGLNECHLFDVILNKLYISNALHSGSCLVCTVLGAWSMRVKSKWWEVLAAAVSGKSYAHHRDKEISLRLFAFINASDVCCHRCLGFISGITSSSMPSFTPSFFLSLALLCSFPLHVLPPLFSSFLCLPSLRLHSYDRLWRVLSCVCVCSMGFLPFRWSLRYT